MLHAGIKVCVVSNVCWQVHDSRALHLERGQRTPLSVKGALVLEECSELYHGYERLLLEGCIVTQEWLIGAQELGDGCPDFRPCFLTQAHEVIKVFLEGTPHSVGQDVSSLPRRWYRRLITDVLMDNQEVI